MTRFTVTWNEHAIAELTSAWLASSDRKRLTDAVTAIDAALLHDPELKGIEFYGDRLLVVPPLAVVYVIRQSDRNVEVLLVWHAPAA
jgi:hypothetical protein